VSSQAEADDVQLAVSNALGDQKVDKLASENADWKGIGRRCVIVGVISHRFPINSYEITVFMVQES
jgi:hypothetical protein